MPIRRCSFQASIVVAATTALACTPAPPTPQSAPGMSGTAVAAARDTIERRIDSYVRAQMARRRIPGLALAVVRDGITVYIKGYGVADIEQNTPVTPETVFDLSSITKTFTASAIMLLAQNGRLRIDGSIREYVAESPSAWSGITVRHLLTHTAGFPETDVPTVNGAWLADYTSRQMFEHASTVERNTPPGERYLYSDLGYFLLGTVIEHLGGIRYGEFLQRSFFTPFGMASTRLLDQNDVVPHRAGIYFLRDGQLVRSRRYALIELSSAYGILTTAQDFVKWETALARGQVLSPSALEAMWTSGRTNNGFETSYGFGWDVYELNGHRAVGHAGGTGTYYLRLPEDRLAVIVLTNLVLGSLERGRMRLEGSNPRTIAQAVADLYVPGLLMSRLTEQQDSDPQRTAGVRSVLADIVARRFESPLLSANLMDALRRNARRVPTSWLVETAPFELLACEPPRGTMSRFDVPITRVCHYWQEHPLETRYTSVYEGADRRIADLQFQPE